MNTPTGEGREKGPSAGQGAPPELVPVKASVFDDDFFRASTSRVELVSGAEPTHFSAPVRVQQEEVSSVTEEVFPLEASVRVPSFAAGTVAVANAEPDELDIPAFLRRGN
jgi:cell division protein FtsZ